MSDQALGSPLEAAPTGRVTSLRDVFWMVLQPVLLLGSAFLVATVLTGKCMNHML